MRRNRLLYDPGLQQPIGLVMIGIPVFAPSPRARDLRKNPHQPQVTESYVQEFPRQLQGSYLVHKTFPKSKEVLTAIILWSFRRSAFLCLQTQAGEADNRQYFVQMDYVSVEIKWVAYDTLSR